jgi:hypothetical protein
MTFRLSGVRYSICQLPPAAEAPPNAWSVVRTVDELSVICRAGTEPEGAKVDAGWRILTLVGTFDLDEVGVLAGILPTFVELGVSVFVISTFNTDHILVRDENVARLQAVPEWEWLT